MRRNKRKIIAIKLIFVQMIMLFSFCGVCHAEEEQGILNDTEENVLVNEEPLKTVKPVELDLGEYEASMSAGSKQLLSVTVLPLDATNQTITYKSSNENVATINGMGRITAVSVGTAYITASCGEINQSFLLTVKEKETNEGSVAVTDIELAAYENELEVDKTLTLSATVLPNNAKDTVVEFISENPEIATVSSTGEVKGIAPGQVGIVIKAGDFTKTITLTVKIAATNILLNSNYVILKTGESFQLEGSVQPKGASQILNFKSTNDETASVSSNGLVRANKTGNTTIVVSGKDISQAVTVIVNQDGIDQEADSASPTQESTAQSAELEIIAQIQGKKQTKIRASEYPVISKGMLKALYTSGNTLYINGDGYRLKLCGTDIINYENELYTDIAVKNTGKGIEFTLNEGRNLPGAVTVCIDQKDCQFMYLYNAAKKKYEQLQQKFDGTVVLDVQGKYLLAERQLTNLKIPLLVCIILSVLLVIGIVVYIVIKKKYWFW